MVKLTTKEKVNEITNVVFTEIYHNKKIVGRCFRTFHPTVRYEVFFNKSGKSERCKTIAEACKIVSDFLKTIN